MNDLRTAVEVLDANLTWGELHSATLDLIDAHQCSALDVERLTRAIERWYRTPVNVATTAAHDSAKWIAREYAALLTEGVSSTQHG